MYNQARYSVKCKQLFIVVLAFVGVGKGGFSQFESPVYPVIEDSIIGIYPDDPYILSLDSLYHTQFLDDSLVFFSDFNPELAEMMLPDSVPDLDPKKVEAILNSLDSLTPIELTYNKQTQKMIEFYILRRREMLGRVVGLSELYFPLFEQEFEKEGLPMELKHLAVVESALMNVIRSRAGAVGLWQFMYNTGRYLGIEINSYVDERRDPVVATKSAVKYLKYLYGLYGDWHLALAAYNAGPGNVNKAIRRSGGKRNFWELYRYLPRETRSYVPAFIAVNYALADHRYNGIVPRPARYRYGEIDSVHVKKAVSFDQIAEVLCLDLEEIRFLNPQYKLDFIPRSKDDRSLYVLNLPYRAIGEFLTNEEAIYSYEFWQDTVQTDSAIVELDEIHKVRSGESLGRIAERYGVSVRSLKRWNNLKKNTIHPGQKLVIRKKGVKTASNPAMVQGEIEYYRVRKGETLSEIAEKFGVSTNSIARLNGIKRKDRLYPGTKLKIRKVKK